MSPIKIPENKKVRTHWDTPSFSGWKFHYINEVHKYPNWSVELKNIYDGLPEMQVIFSASSALDIYRSEADLSKMVVRLKSYWA